ncbi:MAG: hypothetical protein HRU15_14735, partial [Planctomycetes bacterium]|nr:hypothetical protein [Planctomycetota bacterium]
MTMSLIMWWNAYNLFDDQDDPQYDDIVRSSAEFHRDLREISEVLAALEPAPCFIGLGEIENKNVLNQLIQELRWHPKHRGFICEHYINSKDPRGIDLAYLQKDDGEIQVDHVRELWPQHTAAVRPVLLFHCRLQGECFRLA